MDYFKKTIKQEGRKNMIEIKTRLNPDFADVNDQKNYPDRQYPKTGEGLFLAAKDLKARETEIKAKFPEERASYTWMDIDGKMVSLIEHDNSIIQINSQEAANEALERRERFLKAQKAVGERKPGFTTDLFPDNQEDSFINELIPRELDRLKDPNDPFHIDSEHFIIETENPYCYKLYTMIGQKPFEEIFCDEQDRLTSVEFCNNVFDAEQIRHYEEFRSREDSIDSPEIYQHNSKTDDAVIMDYLNSVKKSKEDPACCYFEADVNFAIDQEHKGVPVSKIKKVLASHSPQALISKKYPKEVVDYMKRKVVTTNRDKSAGIQR